MGNYGIAYLDQTGAGFSKNQPFIEFFDRKCDKQEIQKHLEEMNREGYKNITLFRFDKWYDEEPEGYYSWDWILYRKVNYFEGIKKGDMKI